MNTMRAFLYALAAAMALLSTAEAQGDYTYKCDTLSFGFDVQWPPNTLLKNYCSPSPPTSSNVGNCGTITVDVAKSDEPYGDPSLEPRTELRVQGKDYKSGATRNVTFEVNVPSSAWGVNIFQIFEDNVNGANPPYRGPCLQLRVRKDSNGRGYIAIMQADNTGNGKGLTVYSSPLATDIYGKYIKIGVLHNTSTGRITLSAPGKTVTVADRSINPDNTVRYIKMGTYYSVDSSTSSTVKASFRNIRIR